MPIFLYLSTAKQRDRDGWLTRHQLNHNIRVLTDIFKR